MCTSTQMWINGCVLLQEEILIWFPAFKRTACCGRVLVGFSAFPPWLLGPHLLGWILWHSIIVCCVVKKYIIYIFRHPQVSFMGRGWSLVQISDCRAKIITPPSSQHEKWNQIKLEVGEWVVFQGRLHLPAAVVQDSIQPQALFLFCSHDNKAFILPALPPHLLLTLCCPLGPLPGPTLLFVRMYISVNVQKPGTYTLLHLQSSVGGVTLFGTSNPRGSGCLNTCQGGMFRCQEGV